MTDVQDHAFSDTITEAVEQTEPVAPPIPRNGNDDDDMPLPTDPRTILMIGLFVLEMLAALYVASEIILPVGLYLGVHVIEGEITTPVLMARRFTINPVAVILALIFWYWMWGVPGAILAVSMLAIVKIVSDDVRPLRAFGHLLEG